MHDPFTALQRLLESMYRVDGTPPVEAFRTPRVVAEALGAGREALLVHEDGEHTDLGLYVDEAEVARAARALAARARGEHVADEDVDGLAVLVEGVSHFVYFTFAGLAHERAVSRIELELQAELDKFLVLRLFFGVDGTFERLFRRFELAAHLDAEGVERYAVASSRASRYARWLERRMRRGHTEAALVDARRVYRMPLAEKLEHIARAA